MEQKEYYRYELNYVIGYFQYLKLKNRLRCITHLDSHTGMDGKYLVRNIYFDNLTGKSLEESLNSISEKFYMRYYNNDFSFITLEKKVKNKDLNIKYTSVITQKEYESLLNGEYRWLCEHPSPIAKELYVKIRTQMLCPEVLLSYIREPYIYGIGNVRITFDSNMQIERWHRDILKSQVYDAYVTSYPKKMMLKIRYNDFLPEIIKKIIQVKEMQQPISENIEFAMA